MEKIPEILKGSPATVKSKVFNSHFQKVAPISGKPLAQLKVLAFSPLKASPFDDLNGLHALNLFFYLLLT